LCETGPALSKIDTSGCGSGDATPDLSFSNGRFLGPSAPPRICSNTRGRLAKNIPVRVNKVTVGIENSIRDHPRVNDFFQFFKNIFTPIIPRRRYSSFSKTKTPANPLSMGFGGRVILYCSV